jgi:PAT family beta-lactamase induction signal transducer AmpG
MRPPWSDPLATRAGRLLSFFLLYVSEGIPSGFTATAIATSMRRGGLDPAVIGAYVGALYLPWAFKWAVGPIVDTISSRRFGWRRTWIVGAQLGMILTLLVALPVDFNASLGLFTGILLVHNIFAATQDVAIDALAVQVLPPEERGTANGFMFAGQSVGIALGGSGILLLTSVMPFRSTYLVIVAALAIILVLVPLRLRETAAPLAAIAETARGRLARVGRELAAFIGEARRAFTGTRSAGLGVLFAVLPMGAYALGLALQSNLAVELGLSDDRIGVLGLWSGLAGALGCVVGGWLSDRFGRRRMIALFILAMSVPGVWLALAMQRAGHIAAVDPAIAAAAGAAAAEPGLVATFLAACIAFNFAQGLQYGASTALFMDITTPAVAAT